MGANKGRLMRFEMNANGFIDRAETHGGKPCGMIARLIITYVRASRSSRASPGARCNVMGTCVQPKT